MLNLSIGARLDVRVLEQLSDIAGARVSFYGAPGGFSLDGGRITDESWDDFRSAVIYLSAHKIPFNLCCNTVLDPDRVTLTDRTLATLELAHRPGNGIIVARHWLARRLRDQFPQYRLIFSSIGVLVEDWLEDRLFADYDVVVCPVNRISDFTLLGNPRHWCQLEVFLNNECAAFGEQCLGHYHHTSLVNAGLTKRAEFSCPTLRKPTSGSTAPQPSVNDIRKYISLGVTRFKLIDRTASKLYLQPHLTRLKAAQSREQRQ